MMSLISWHTLDFHPLIANRQVQVGNDNWMTDRKVLLLLVTCEIRNYGIEQEVIRTKGQNIYRSTTIIHGLSSLLY